MDVFFAMGTPTTEDSSGYFLRLPHLWSVYVVPFVCFYAILAVWVVRKIRSAAGTRCGSAGSAILPAPDVDHSASDVAGPESEEQIPGPFDLRFYRCRSDDDRQDG